jgi:hypothetical protein
MRPLSSQALQRAWIIACDATVRHRRTGAERRDPAIHRFREKMDARVKPAHDHGEGVSRMRGSSPRMTMERVSAECAGRAHA